MYQFFVSSPFLQSVIGGLVGALAGAVLGGYFTIRAAKITMLHQDKKSLTEEVRKLAIRMKNICLMYDYYINIFLDSRAFIDSHDNQTARGYAERMNELAGDYELHNSLLIGSIDLINIDASGDLKKQCIDGRDSFMQWSDKFNNLATKPRSSKEEKDALRMFSNEKMKDISDKMDGIVAKSVEMSKGTTKKKW